MPRYDVPKAAPEPLRQVQLLLNSEDQENEVDWLADWLAEHGIPDQVDQARDLRHALRALVLANNGVRLEKDAVAIVNEAAARLRLALDADGRVRVNAHDPLDEIVAIALAAVLDGSWRRLKACRNCHWSFYDYSPNRSATWCSMQLCGNRKKTRAYRARKRAA
jgi:predicted RNA-binding Zn ribbon-like protein